MENIFHTAAIYARVSTKKQAREGFSLESQIKACRKKANELGITNIVEYTDETSGTTLNRPGLLKLRKEIKNGTIDIVICYDQDRLSRKLGQQLFITEEFEKFCKKLVFVYGDYKHSVDGRLSYLIKGAIAEYEREKILERCMRGKKEKFLKGEITNSHLFGYKYNKNKKTYEINDDEAKVVRRIFDLYINGMSSRQILMLFQMENIPKFFRGKSVGWNDPSVILRILKNDSYTGVFHAFKHNSPKEKNRYKDKSEWINIPIPAIIDKEQFELANKKIKENTDNSSRNEKRTHLLSRIARCTCGRSIYSRTANNKDYYICASKNYKKKDESKYNNCLTTRSMLADKVDEMFWKALSKICISKENIEKYVNQQENNIKVDSILLQIKKIEESINKKKKEQNKIIEWFTDSLIDDNLAKEKLEKISKLLINLKKQKEELTKSVNRKNKPEFIYNIFKNEKKVTLEEKRNLIRKIVDKVYVERIDDNKNSKMDIRIYIIFK